MNATLLSLMALQANSHPLVVAVNIVCLIAVLGLLVYVLWETFR